MTGPLDESTPLEDCYGSEDLASCGIGEMDDDQWLERSRRLIDELAQRSREAVALAEEAQRVVERIVLDRDRT